MANRIIKELGKAKIIDKTDNVFLKEQWKTYNCAIDKAIEIIKKYDNDGWISVKENRDKFPIVQDEKEKVDVIITTWNGISSNIEYTEYDEIDGFNTINKVLAWRYDNIKPYKGE